MLQGSNIFNGAFTVKALDKMLTQVDLWPSWRKWGKKYSSITQVVWDLCPGNILNRLKLLESLQALEKAGWKSYQSIDYQSKYHKFLIQTWINLDITQFSNFMHIEVYALSHSCACN